MSNESIRRNDIIKYCEMWRDRAKELKDRNGWWMADHILNYVMRMDSVPIAELIPCSERLPEKSQKYLIYYQDYINGVYDYAVEEYCKTPHGWEFEFYNESNNCEVIAWMPLSKLYKESE